MKLYNKIEIPDKMFGLDSSLLVLFLPLLGLILGLFVVLNLVLMPKIDSISAVMAKIESVEKESNDVATKRNYLLSIDQEELKKNAAYVNSALLPEKNSYLLINVIRKIADKYGFQVDSFQIKLGEITKKAAPVSAVDAVAKVPVTFKLIGPRPQYLSLVNGLEKSLPILSIEDFKMVSSEELVTMDITVSASYVGNTAKVNANKLSLADLTLKKDESELITRLNKDFSVVVNSNQGRMTTARDYVKFDRTDPFSL